MPKPVYQLSVEEAQRYALELLERQLTEDELDRLREVLRTTTRMRQVVEEAMRVVTEGRGESSSHLA